MIDVRKKGGEGLGPWPGPGVPLGPWLGHGSGVGASRGPGLQGQGQAQGQANINHKTYQNLVIFKHSRGHDRPNENSGGAAGGPFQRLIKKKT